MSELQRYIPRGKEMIAISSGPSVGSYVHHPAHITAVREAVKRAEKRARIDEVEKALKFTEYNDAEDVYSWLKNRIAQIEAEAPDAD